MLSQIDIILGALAASRGAVHSPVQIQKLLFLLDKKLAKELGGPHFNFIPHHYGPFDRTVYDLLEKLAKEGMVEILRNPALRWRNYRSTPEGQEAGEKILGQLDSRVADYIRQLSAFVRKLSFAELVTTVYAAYPAMKVNSVFRE